MPQKTKIIFITTFIIVGIIILGFYFWSSKNPSVSTTNTQSSWYQSFNPFGNGSQVATTPITNNETSTEVQNQDQGTSTTPVNKFYQITDFSVAGATFLDDIRPIAVNPNTQVVQAPEPARVVISPDTKAGRIEIQKFLNTTLSLKPQLATTGVLDKKTVDAIKSFQKLNNLGVTGKIDTFTAPYFTKIAQGGATTPIRTTEIAPSIRYVERMNGHIYKMFLDTKNKEKISNSTIPSIYETFFDNTGNTFVYRYLSEDKSINSFMASLGAPSGEFLPQNISDFSTSIDKTKFFYITENNNGASGVVGTFGNTKKDIVFNSPFTEWLSQWDNNQKIYLTTKPSYTANGTIFVLNTTTKTTTKVFGGVPGLTTLVNHNGSLVLFSTSTSSGPKLSIFDIKKHTTKELDRYGLSDKCVWSIDNITIYCSVPNVINGNQYPDSWYQGLVSFDDFFIKINSTTGDSETIANSTSETPVDGTNLFLDKQEKTLFFTNKKDSTLWGLGLNN
ncbi:MAG: peptidoglycan-binding domain-containing protein [Candidatus Nomurabacteria bacterium]|nr:peptidoglycan-binding domain-containing protein [Candidatus Nomurabacteria bacterium]